jgi:TatD DNase family protein
MLIDSHCHLDAKWFENDIPNVIQNAKDKGIEAIITSSISPDIQQTKTIVDTYPNYVFWALGLHPPGVDPQRVQTTTALLEQYEGEIVAIGEVGLDYYWVKEQHLREQQKEAFIFFIDVAAKLGKPLVVHARDAHAEAIEILEENGAKDVLMHCFSGSEKEAERVIKNRWYISVPTSVVNRKVHQMMARIVPLDLMLLETDAPYLAPTKGRNESANIKISAQKIAEIKSTSFEEIAQKTTSNARKFYRLSERIE